MQAQRWSDLARLYQLFSRVNGLDNIRKFFVAYLMVCFSCPLFAVHLMSIMAPPSLTPCAGGPRPCISRNAE